MELISMNIKLVIASITKVNTNSNEE